MKKTIKIACNNPLGAYSGAVVTREPVANADGNPAHYNTNDDDNDDDGEKTPWWEVVGSIGNTVSGVLGSVFPFFNKSNQGTATIVKTDSNDMFKYLIFGVLAIVALLLVFRFTRK